MSECPCQSGRSFAECCEPFLAGARVPETAEQTMRARYAAYTRVDTGFLMATVHPRSREDDDEESARTWASESEWLGLEIVSTSDGGPGDATGEVEFIARYRSPDGQERSHHERSRFAREKDRWYFVEGRTVGPAPLRREGPRVGRNDPCPCGSGRKHKKCCAGA